MDTAHTYRENIIGIGWHRLTMENIVQVKDHILLFLFLFLVHFVLPRLIAPL